jgi:hypothetical protein
MGTEKLEEWLPDEEVEADAVPDAMEMIQERELFNDMFNRTLAEMGELS